MSKQSQKVNHDRVSLTPQGKSANTIKNLQKQKQAIARIQLEETKKATNPSEYNKNIPKSKQSAEKQKQYDNSNEETEQKTENETFLDKMQTEKEKIQK